MIIDINTALAELGEYADQLAQSEGLADRDSLSRAITTQRLYESFSWVEEWNAQKPIPQRSYGRPADPRGRNRFSQWLAWRLEKDGHRPIRGSHSYRLLDAAAVVTSFPSWGKKSMRSEAAVRPLTWLSKHQYADRIPDVWERAVELAGSENAVTSVHTRQAVNAWKKDTLGTKGIKQAVRTAKAARDRAKAQVQVQQLFADGDQAEVERFHQWYIDLCRASQENAK